MTQEKLMQFLDACFDAKRLIEKLPDLPDGMKPRQVHVLDAVKIIFRVDFASATSAAI